MASYQDSEAQTERVIVDPPRKATRIGRPSLVDDFGGLPAAYGSQHAGTQTDAVTVRAVRGPGQGVSGQKRRRGTGVSRLSKRAKTDSDETGEGVESDPLAELDPQALQQLSAEEQTRFVQYAQELQSHADKTLERRAWSIPNYGEKASFYIRCLLIGRQAPALELRNPFSANGETCSAISDVQSARQTAPWLSGFCLSMMRSLNFLGNDIDGETGSADRYIGFILQQLGFHDAAAAQFPLPWGRELVAWTRCKFASKIRMLGRHLKNKKLVHKAATGHLVWEPACDQFNDPAWTWPGRYPAPDEPSKFPDALDPGYLLPVMEAAGTSETGRRLDDAMDHDGLANVEDSSARPQTSEDNAEWNAATAWKDVVDPRLASLVSAQRSDGDAATG